MKTKLTLIIPFLNEGIEIENTLKSIRESAHDKIEILLINDCSTDKFDYPSIAKKYNTRYHLNLERKGVAQSRNIGVSLINTPYFLLLDGHMRFYNNNWWEEFVKELEKDDRAVYCGNCLPLDETGIIIEKYNKIKSFGAFVNFEECNPSDILEPTWITIDDNLGNSTPEIPCVLGASYALSVRYWNYIQGLNGLRYYGNDETFLSMKVWLEGGKCILLKEIEIGHIFRDSAPFPILTPDRIYNKLFIAKTLFPKDSNIIEMKIKQNYPADYYLVKSLFKKEQNRIEADSNYYKSIFTKEFSFFLKKNNQTVDLNSLKIKIDRQLSKIADLITVENNSIGLMNGEMGEIVFLYEYAVYSRNQFYGDIAFEKLSRLLSRLQNDLPNFSFIDGMTGIGIALNYLINQNYIEYDCNELFGNFEKSMRDLISKNVSNNKSDFLHEYFGIISYFIANGNKVFNDDLIKKYIHFIEKEIVENQHTVVMSYLSLFLNAYDNDKDNISLKKLILKYSNYLRDSYLINQLSLDSGGDLIVGYTLLKVSKQLSIIDLECEAVNRILNTCNRKDSICEHLFDASLTKGSAGTALIYHSAYLYTNRVEFRAAAEYWATDVLLKEIPEFELYIPYNTGDRKFSKSLSYGLSGIGLSLLAINSDESPLWKSWIRL
jgi:glycosyltransferase involved in cell wall biosynthesis